jgi:PAS domain S-box-containing protein
VEKGLDARSRVRIIYLIAAGAWLVLVDLVFLTAIGGRMPRPMGVAGSWSFVAVSAVLLATLGGREIVSQRQQARLFRQHQAALEALGALTEPSLAILPVEQLLEEMLARLLTTMGVDTATIYLLSDDGSELISRASLGRGSVLTEGHHLSTSSGIAAQIVNRREPLISNNPASLGELAPALRTLASLAGCPIVMEDRLIGICLVGTIQPMEFTDADIQLLQLVADRVGAGVERSRLDEAERRSRAAADHARQHLTLLARVSETLSTAIDDYETPVASLTDVIVPDFGDWCAVDMVDESNPPRRLAIRHSYSRAANLSDGLIQAFPGLSDLWPRAIRRGRTELGWSQPSEGSEEAAGARCVVVPIRVRRRTIGLITIGADPGRAGYVESDVSTAEEVATRAAITAERVLLYRQAQTREARWRALLEATPAGIVEVDLNGEVLVSNRFAATMFGWESDGPAATSDPRQWPEGTAKRLGPYWARAANGEEISDAQVTVAVAGGEERDLAVSTAPLRAANGRVQGILTLAVDVTERRRFQEGLREAQRMEALGQVAGGVAHDFNNLLTVITGYADLLTRRLTLGREDQQLFDNIRSAADRASVLTNQLLTISRRQVAKPVVLAPHATLQAIADVLQRILGIDVTLQWDLDLHAGNIRIDPGRFEQLILNLAINARDAMPDGGSLKIATAAELVSQSALGPGLGAGRYVRISVTDTGTGMDEETRRRCLEPFFTTKDRTKGTGLGLAAVKGIVEDSGGSIDIQSQLGEGTTFTMYLPAVDVEEELPPEPSVPETDSPRGSETVLVVDDQPDIRELIRKVLHHDGYLVLEAASGSEAIRIAERWEGPVELLVTDVMMPNMRGPEVAAAVRELRPNIEVLFISGYAHGTTLPSDLVADPLTFLAKPFKPSELGDRVRAILDHHYQKARTGTPLRGRS